MGGARGPRRSRRGKHRPCLGPLHPAPPSAPVCAVTASGNFGASLLLLLKALYLYVQR
jgi:hypothetical protein